MQTFADGALELCLGFCQLTLPRLELGEATSQLLLQARVPETVQGASRCRAT